MAAGAGMYAYVGNKDATDGTTSLRINWGEVRLGGWGAFTADEVTYFDQHFYLVPAGSELEPGAPVEVEDFDRDIGETHDSSRIMEAAAYAATEHRMLTWKGPLVLGGDGVTIPDFAYWVGAGDLVVDAAAPPFYPLHKPAGGKEMRLVGFTIDGNKDAIGGNPDVTGSPENLVMVGDESGTISTEIYTDLKTKNAPRLGIVYQNVQGGELKTRCQDHNRDGATIYFDSKDILVDVRGKNVGDDLLGVNSGSGATTGRCENIHGRVVGTGPSTRQKGRTCSVRGGRNIKLDVIGRDMSQTALALSNWGATDLEDFDFKLVAYRPGQGGSVAAEKHGVLFEISNGGRIHDGKVAGVVNGALDRGLTVTNFKGAPAAGDMENVDIDMDIANCANDGINLDAAGIDRCRVLASTKVHGCGGWGLTKTSQGDGNVFLGDYFDNANGVRARIQGNCTLKPRAFDTRAGGARTQQVGVNFAFLFGTVVYEPVAYNNVAAQLQNDGGNVVSEWVPNLASLQAPQAPVSLNNQKITNLAAPTAAGDATSKTYVDAVAAGYQQHASVRAASIVNQALGAAGSRTVDGVTCVTGDRVLLKAQTFSAENGIYVVNADFSLSRAGDGTTNNLKAGATVWVNEGAANADTAWTLTTNDPVNVGVTAQAWTQSSALGQITAGSGLTKTGSQLDVGAGTGILVAADSIAADADNLLPWTIDIDPFMPAIDQVGSWAMFVSNTYLYGGTKHNGNAPAVNDQLGWDLVLAPGVYRVSVTHDKGPDRGIISLTVDGATVGTIDAYAAASTLNVIDTAADFTLATAAGKRRFRLKMATKNASSTNFTIGLQRVRITRIS